MRQALEELYDDLDAGVYDGAVGRGRFRDKKRRADERLEAVEAKLAELAEPESALLPIGEWLPEDPETDPVGPGSWWAEADRDAKREFITLFIHKITIYKAATRWGHARRANYKVGDRVAIEFVKPTLDESEEAA